MIAPKLASSPALVCRDLLVVSGPPRSGTTWLQRELCKLPGTFPFLPECTYITQQISLFHATVHYGEQKRTEAFFGDRKAIQDYFRLNVERMLDLVANLNSRSNARLLILKDPELCHCLDALSAVLPPHKIVIIVRDPRDVLASMKQVAARRKEHWNIRTASKLIANYYYQISNFLSNTQPNVILVRYEDVVTEPSDKKEDLLRFVGIQPDHLLSMTSDAAVGKMMNSEDPFFSDLYLKPTTVEKVGSFRKILGWWELSYFESSYLGIIRQWGYQPDSTKARALSFFSKTIRNFSHALSSR